MPRALTYDRPSVHVGKTRDESILQCLVSPRCVAHLYDHPTPATDARDIAPPNLSVLDLILAGLFA